MLECVYSASWCHGISWIMTKSIFLSSVNFYSIATVFQIPPTDLGKDRQYIVSGGIYSWSSYSESWGYLYKVSIHTAEIERNLTCHVITHRMVCQSMPLLGALQECSGLQVAHSNWNFVHSRWLHTESWMLSVWKAGQPSHQLSAQYCSYCPAIRVEPPSQSDI